MIITQTPFRLSFFGGGTDYRPWFEKNGGLVVASAMNHYCYITVRHLPPFFDHKSRIVYSKIESVTENSLIEHRAVRECLRFMDNGDALEIHHDGDLPARSGIGSSSSFTVGMLNALHALKFEMISKQELAEEAIKVEQDYLKEVVGIQDQIMAAYGGLQVIEMGPGYNFTVNPLIISPEYQTSLEQHVLLAFTGISRTSSDYASRQQANILDGSSQAYLSEISGIAHEGLGVFRKQSDLKKIGELLDKSWKLKKQLAKGISNSSVDEMYEVARKNGAYGGKLLGAGGGGFIMFFAPPDRHDQIKAALPQLKVWVPYGIDTYGARVVLHTERRDRVERRSLKKGFQKQNDFEGKSKDVVFS